MAHTAGERLSEQVRHTATRRNSVGTTLTKTFVTETPNPMAAQSNRRSGFFPGKRFSHGSFRAFPSSCSGKIVSMVCITMLFCVVPHCSLLVIGRALRTSLKSNLAWMTISRSPCSIDGTKIADYQPLDRLPSTTAIQYRL